MVPKTQVPVDGRSWHGETVAPGIRQVPAGGRKGDASVGTSEPSPKNQSLLAVWALFAHMASKLSDEFARSLAVVGDVVERLLNFFQIQRLSAQPV